jgi:hypothetical protein
MRRSLRTTTIASALVSLAVLVLTVPPVAAASTATLQSEQEGPPGYQQGLARVADGWIFTGTATMGRTNEQLKVVKTNNQPIPLEWKRKGFNHVGDPDVAGKFLYAPLEQSQYERGDQAMARYDAKSLKLVDIVPVTEHEASFVTVDPKTMIAYSMDRFGGDALLRYDLRKNWAPLPPLAMSRFVDKVQGADVADGAVWLSTSNDTNELFRVDLKTGQVDDLGSAGHIGGEGEGIDATELKSGRLHTLTVDPTRAPIWFGHFTVS